MITPMLVLLAAQIGPIAADAPARQPQMAVAGSTVDLAFGAANAVYFSSSSNGGKTFSEPVKVAQAESMLLGRHRGPRIAAMTRSIVITSVMGKAGDLVAWRSADGGKTWSTGVVVNDVPRSSNEGLHALASDGRDRVFAIWLDHRGGHGTKLYGSLSMDGGATWSKNVLVYESPDGTICECCHPSLAFDASGEILAMWRNSLAGSRDLYLARSRDGVHFSKAEKMGEGTWKLNACPMDGGGVVATKNGLTTAWRRESEIFLSSPGREETRIGPGKDVSIAGGKNGVYAIWSSPAGIQLLAPGKQASAIAAAGAFPTIVALPGGGAVAAWEVENRISIEIVP
jgi:hypothetical protein